MTNVAKDKGATEEGSQGDTGQKEEYVGIADDGYSQEDGVTGFYRLLVSEGTQRLEGVAHGSRRMS